MLKSNQLRNTGRKFFWQKMKDYWNKRKFIPVIKLHKFNKDEISNYKKKLEDYFDRDAPFVLMNIRDKNYDKETIEQIKNLFSELKSNFNHQKNIINQFILLLKKKIKGINQL